MRVTLLAKKIKQFNGLEALSTLFLERLSVSSLS